MELVLSISEEGKVESMYSDEFRLSFLGQETIRRQTDIVFDGTWSLVYLDAEEGRHPIPEAGSFDTYEEARRFEVLWLNDCRAKGYDPIGDKGRVDALLLRESLEWLAKNR